jgi:lysozyme family protein
MSTFDLAIPVVLLHEGGWVSNPADPGGETNFGISTLIIKRENITADQLGIDPSTMFQPGYLKPMTVDAAKAIYKQYFWDKYGYQFINDQTAATKVFDCSVNCGPGRAGTFAQQAADVCGAQLALDGNLGPLSYAAINQIDPKTFIHAFGNSMRFYYNSIVLHNPSLRVFLGNWLRRSTWGE